MMGSCLGGTVSARGPYTWPTTPCLNARAAVSYGSTQCGATKYGECGATTMSMSCIHCPPTESMEATSLTNKSIFSFGSKLSASGKYRVPGSQVILSFATADMAFAAADE